MSDRPWPEINDPYLSPPDALLDDEDDPGNQEEPEPWRPWYCR